MMETIKFGKHVELAYEIFVVSNGKDVSVYKFDESHPDGFVFGMDQTMIDGFMKHIEGLGQGSDFDFTLEPKDAFGERNPDFMMELDKNIFEVNGEFDSEKVYEGAMVPMMTQEGMRVEGRVLSITRNKVKIDFNHQLAGEKVRYKGKVLVVRDATQEELTPKHSCSCGDCGSDCDCEGGGESGGCSGCSCG